VTVLLAQMGIDTSAHFESNSVKQNILPPIILALG
jgi:hypothetical protein